MKKTIFLTLMLAILASTLFGAWTMYQDFDNFGTEGFPPPGWSRLNNNTGGGNGWVALTGTGLSEYAAGSSAASPIVPDCWLATPFIDFGNDATMVKSLQYDQASQSAINHLWVYMSTVDTGDPVADFLGANGSLIYDHAFRGNISAYTHETVDRTGITGPVRFAFRHQSPTNGGWAFIDNVGVWFQYEDDLAITSLTTNKVEVDLDATAPNNQVTITGIVSNWGTIPASGYTVKLWRVGASSPLETWPAGSSIAVGQTRAIEHSYIPPAGTGMLYMTLEHATDEVPSNNDSKTITFSVVHGSTLPLVRPLDAYPSINPVANSYIPAQFYNYYSYTQSIYKAAEMGSTPRTITSLAFSFINRASIGATMPVRVFMGYTTLNEFAGTANWVTTANMTEVFTGTIGQLTMPPLDANGADLVIPFTTNFPYNGTQNVVVAFFCGNGSAYGGSTSSWFMAKTLTSTYGGQNRTLYITRDDSINITNPGDGTRTSAVPVIKFGFPPSAPPPTVDFYITVTDEEGAPVSGVKVGRLDDPNVFLMTDNFGLCNFPEFIIENDGLYATKPGYAIFNCPALDNSEGDLGDDDVWEFDIVLADMPTHEVSGTVLVGWNDEPVEDLTVTFTHPEGAVYEAITDATGDFEIDLPQNATYTLTIAESALFQAVVRLVPVAQDDVLLGNILLIEKNLQPIMLRATPNTTDSTHNDVSWMSPFSPANTFTYVTPGNSTSLGIGGNTFTAFTRFGMTEFLAGVGANFRKIYRVAFVPAEPLSIATYTITIVHFTATMSATPSADYPTYTDGTVLCEQALAPYQFIEGEWNYIDLDTPVDVHGLTGQIWIGVTATYPADTYPISARTTEPTTYRGDIYYLPGSGGYNQLGTQNFGNWLLAAYTVDTDTRGASPTRLANSSLQANKTRVFGETPNTTLQSSQTEIDIQPLHIAHSYNPMYRAMTNYELYRVPTTAYNTPVSGWGNYLINGTLNNVTEFEDDGMIAASGVPWVYGLVAVYNDGHTNPSLTAKSAPIYSTIQTSTVATVTITVTDEEGAVLDDDDVDITMTHLIAQNAQLTNSTFAAGVFTFTGVPYGNWSINVSGDGYFPNTVTLAVFEEDVDVAIELMIGQLIVRESFEGDTFPPAGWLKFDVNNDAKEWSIDAVPSITQHSYDGAMSVYSESYCNEDGQCLYPDNWLITPELSITEGEEYTLSFAIRSEGRNVNQETIAIYYISTELTSSTTLANFQDMLTDLSDDPYEVHWYYGNILPAYGAQIFEFTTTTQNWIPLSIPLSDIALLGASDLEHLRIAFRHWHSSDNHFLMLDDIRITSRPVADVYAAGIVKADDTDQPLAGVSVNWVSTVNAQQTGTTTTNAIGAYDIGSVSPALFNFNFIKEGYANYSAGISVSSGTIPTVTMKKLYDISGFVYLGAEGTTALEGATVTFSQNNIVAATAPATGATGAYAVQLTNGAYDVTITYTSHYLPTVHNGTYTVAGTATGVNFNVLPQPMHAITGKFGFMTGEDFTPITGATVAYANVLGAGNGYSPDNVTTLATTGQEGNYTINTVIGSYNVTITGATDAGVIYEYMSTSPQLVEGPVTGFPQKLGTPKNFTITGKTGYMDGTTFTALGGAAVSYTNVAGGTPITAESSTTEGSIGEFSITVPSGLYNISITATAGAVNYAYTATATLVAADAASHPNVVMVAAYTISGVVKKNMVGNPLFAGATVKLVDTTTPTTIFTAVAATGANGEYSILSVVPGTYIVRVTFTQDGEQTWDRTAPFVVPTDGTTLEIIVTHALTGEDIVELPTVTVLKANYPNPFNPSTTIAFDIAQAGNVSIEVYNIKGQKVKTLVDGDYGVGRHSVVWNGDDASGRNVGSGIYFYRMTTSGYSSIQKMLLMK